MLDTEMSILHGKLSHVYIVYCFWVLGMKIQMILAFVMAKMDQPINPSTMYDVTESNLVATYMNT